MKHFTRHLLALGMTVALLGCGSALAAEETVPQPETQQPAIAVQLDGEILTFTDAVPQVVEERTFLPFRAVFEAMGAEVSNEDSTITAVRGDTTLTMKLGETAATVTKGGVETALEMDVAPYVDNESWRTYVPVRFAAQAFDCAVGWDQDSSTAIIVDTEKLLTEALEGKHFTYLEKLAAYSGKYNEGIWDMKVDMEGNATLMGAVIPHTATMTGTVQDSEKMAVDMNMKLDMTQFIQLASTLAMQGPEITPEDQAIIDALAQEGIDMEMRFDLAEGKFYMTMGGALMENEGFPEGTWYFMDMNDIYAQAGVDMDWAQLMETSRTVDYTALAKALLADLTPNAASEEGYGISYGVIKQSAENLALALSDEGFTKEGNNYSTLIDAGLYKLGLTLTMKKDAVVGYTMDMTMFMDMDETGSAYLTMTTSMDEKDQMKAHIDMDLSMDDGNGQSVTLMGIELTMEGGYTAGKTAPETQPPADAIVVNIVDMMGQ